MSQNIDLSLLKKRKKYSIEYVNVEEKIDNEFVKRLRGNLNMTQAVFSSVLGLKKRTIEKWEQGINPVKGGSARLLYLLDLYPDMANDLYKVKKNE